MEELEWSLTVSDKEDRMDEPFVTLARQMIDDHDDGLHTKSLVEWEMM